MFLHVLPKKISRIAFVPQNDQAKAVPGKVTEPFPVIHGRRCDFERCDISFQCDQGMNLETKIRFLFGRTPSIIRAFRAERTAVTCTPEFADRKGKAVDDKITADWYRKGLQQLLAEQLCYLQKGPPGPVKAGTAAKCGEKVLVIAFHKRIPGI